MDFTPDFSSVIATSPTPEQWQRILKDNPDAIGPYFDSLEEQGDPSLDARRYFWDLQQRLRGPEHKYDDLENELFIKLSVKGDHLEIDVEWAEKYILTKTIISLEGSDPLARDEVYSILSTPPKLLRTHSPTQYRQLRNLSQSNLLNKINRWWDDYTGDVLV